MKDMDSKYGISEAFTKLKYETSNSDT